MNRPELNGLHYYYYFFPNPQDFMTKSIYEIIYIYMYFSDFCLKVEIYIFFLVSGYKIYIFFFFG